MIPRIGDLLREGNYILGEPVTRFETDFADFLGARFAVGLNSGTDALILAMDALGIGPGDEVITVANSFHATAMSVVRVGATPVLVDCDPDTHLIDLDAAAAAVTDRTKALLVVHLFGQAVNMRAARALADRHDLLLIEDCAQAVGAYSGDRRVGSDSDAGCWSFAPSKNLAAAGDAGAVSLRAEETTQRLRLLRHFGQVAQNEHHVLGYNSRLDTMQALVLAHKLPHVDAWSRRRVAIAEAYRARLGSLPIRFQAGAGDREHVYHLFQVQTPLRDDLLAHLRADGTDAVVRYPVPMHLQPAFADLKLAAGELPVVERLARETLCLPLFPSMTDAQIDHVCTGVERFFAGSR
nr:DegT/DnrJ/EryC1/StrS family aminotransferase [Streptomyces sp. SID3343]